MLDAPRFLREFALPLIQGGKARAHVGAPLGQDGLLALQRAAAEGLDGTEEGEALRAAREAVLREITPGAEAPRLAADGDEAGDLALLVALHDALFFMHPAAEGPLVSLQRLRQLLEHVQALSQQARPRTVEVALWRHSLTHGLFALAREDVRVSFWAGQREFHGEEPPARLYAWRRLRRVSEERWRVPCYAHVLQAAGGTGRAAVEALLAASPLTDLLSPARLDPPLDLVARARWLQSPQLCRAVAYRYLELGLPTLAGPLRAALRRALEGAAEEERRPAVSRTLCFFSHLHLCHLLSTEAGPAPGSVNDPALRELYALFAALLSHFPALALPADVARDGALSRRVRAYGEACLRTAGAARVNDLARECARVLGEKPGKLLG